MTTIPESLATAVRHHQGGNLQLAEHGYRKVLQADPNQADALHLLGVIAHQVGNHDLAVRYIRRAIRSNPRAAAFHSNLGSAYHALQRLGDAVASYERALRIDPGSVDAYNNLGNALRSQKKLDLAVAAFRRALQLRPDYAEAHNNLGNALQDLRQFNEAVASFQRALQLRPDYAEAHNNLGNVLRDLERFDEALDCYTLALQLRPDYADAFGNLAGMYERLNRPEEAASTAAKGLQIAPEHPLVNLVMAKCEERAGHHQEAIDRLARLRPCDETNLDVARETAFVLARLHDRVGDPAQAFTRFSEANRLAIRGAPDYVGLRDEYHRNLDAFAKLFQPSWVGSWSPAPAWSSEETPVFLIGFARSGTTLLNVVLDSHPGIQTLDEKPTVLAMHKVIGDLPGDFVRALPRLSPAQFERLRTAYFRTADRFIRRQHGLVLVDKNPMNTVEIGLILRVFPAAKFIVAVRHPCDVCLSCFMQDFKMNGGTANFVTLEDSALVYDKVIRLWRQYLRVLPHPYHVVRYEDLVDDFRGETRRLLQFLEVDWDDAVLDYTAHAKQRGMIHTPSYRQVIERIYRRARYRWQRYSERLSPIMGLLQPHIERFGYQDGESLPKRR